MYDFTLVTGLWDIKRGDLKDFNRPFDHYLEKFEKLLQLDFNMYIYIPKELESFVKSRRNMKRTRIVYQELDDFKKNFDFFRDVQLMREKHSWRYRVDWLINSPQATLEYYNPIVMSKFFFVHDAMVINPFNTEYFFWIDAGLANTVDIEQLYNLKNVTEYMRNINKNFLMLSFPYVNDVEVHGFDSKAFAHYCGVEQTDYVCRGGFFGGTKEVLRPLNFEYYSYLGTTLKSNFMGTEENILTMLSYHFPEYVHRYDIGDSGLVYPFFDHLGTIDGPKLEDVNATKNCDLIPWDKKKPIEDIRASLYVLTFNSPKQFETLIESYAKNAPDFLTKTRKILVDNSTDKSTYEQYAKLCRDHNFEHIKKENNIGICGARQFVAEHFNESDSEYYIFLEDDMTAGNPTDDLCDSGYKKYDDDLYFKSLAIIHKNQYDYLKLSYSEFYGTNTTQWSWYNVPQEIREKYFPDRSKLPELGLDPDPPKTEITQEKRYKGLKYLEGEFHYCNWPLWFSRKGNRKVFLDTKWSYPNEQTWMSNVFQLQKEGKIKCAALALSPIFHHRFDFYPAKDRKES